MELHPKSLKMINNIFAMYEDGGSELPKTLSGRTVIHMYPQGDTIDDEGNLKGYYQNLFFDMVVFNATKNGENRMWKFGVKDAVFFDRGVNITSVSIFKDGASCISVDGSIYLLISQAVHIGAI